MNVDDEYGDRGTEITEELNELEAPRLVVRERLEA